MIIERTLRKELLESAEKYPVVTILGPRQSGKTTLVKSTFPGKSYRSLESPDVRQRVLADPRGFLKELAGGAILDESQRGAPRSFFRTFRKLLTIARIQGSSLFPRPDTAEHTILNGILRLKTAWI